MKEKSLIISDIDNTITNFFDMWGDSTAKAFDALAKSRNIPRAALEADVKKHSADASMHDIPTLIMTTPVLRPKSAAEREKFADDDADIIHQWMKDRREGSKLYDGVLRTIKQAKAAGAKLAIYTDSVKSSTLLRLHHMGVDPGLIDKIYTQPDPHTPGDQSKGPPLPGKSPFARFTERLRDKVVTLPPGTHKPNPQVMQSILDDFNVSAADAVMVGDNANDGAGGLGWTGKDGKRVDGPGVEFAWQAQGATLKESTLSLYDAIGDRPDYKLGRDAVAARMKELDVAPTVTLEGGFPDLPRHYAFVKAAGERGKETAVSAARLQAMRGEGRA